MTLSQILEAMKQNVQRIASFLEVSEGVVQFWIDNPITLWDIGIVEAGIISHVAGIKPSAFLEALSTEYPFDTLPKMKES